MMEPKIQETEVDSPLPYEEHNFEDWTVRTQSSHILPSKCTDTCSPIQPCLFCRFTKELSIEHLPEMVYPHNFLRLTHKSGCSIEFTALGALACVKSENLSVKIACAETWRKAREESGLVEKTVGNFDWTFKSDYRGSLCGWECEQTSGEGIDMDRLRRRDNILLFKELILFEDELHDNGISLSNVRIRVMSWGFFILLRHFLRVDGVILSVEDTRFCHDFATPHLIVETSQREAKVSELSLPLYATKEPDELVPLLPLIQTSSVRYSLPNPGPT